MIHILKLQGVKSLSKQEQKSILASGDVFPCFTCKTDAGCCDPAAECVRGACRIWV